MEKLLRAAKDLIANRVGISAAQDLVLKSLLDQLQKEVTRLSKDS